ncbi:hypothetical protein QE250_08705 [Chromatiaceae bacterium AAb-1]|nr:hypothetical protein [Chromatiaceae bacterium AAb-1]
MNEKYKYAAIGFIGIVTGGFIVNLSSISEGLIGVVIGGLITSLILWFKEYREQSSTQERNGRYAAIRIITVLNEYLDKSVDIVSDDGTCHGRPAGQTKDGQEYYCPQARLPEPPTFPEDKDIDWQSIGFKNNELMYRILSLPNLARETDRYIEAASDNSFPPDNTELFEARQEGYARLGLEAIELVEKLQNEFKLSAPPRYQFWNEQWDTQRYLREKRDAIELKRKQGEDNEHV